MRRFGQLIKVKPEKLAYYKELHAKPWPCVIERLKACHFQNYAIFLAPGNQLFAYFEYTGNDFEADQKKNSPRPLHPKMVERNRPLSGTS